jgi:23S rRNA (cytidine2498-2'-O)-methyltransferase
LKYEVLSQQPGLRFAFSRPGLVTFKSERALPLGVPISSHLAILSGLSLGGAKQASDLGPLVRKVWAEPLQVAIKAFAWPTAEDEEPANPSELVGVEQSVREQLGQSEAPARPELEVGVLVPSATQAEFGFWMFARPAGAPTPTERVIPPAEAPSRAYAKLVEALAHFRIALIPGEAVLELGAAPGGATLALLEREQAVIAVDPAKMDERLTPLAAERGLVFRHVERPAQALVPSDVSGLRSPVRWLVSDVNLAPPVAVQQLLRARALVKKTLRGAILTLKLNDTAAVDTLPRVLLELERAFGSTPKVAHLPSHRREVVAVMAG